VGHARDHLDHHLTLLDEDMRAEHRRQPSYGRQLAACLLASQRAGLDDPQQVELGAEALRGAPRTAHDTL